MAQSSKKSKTSRTVDGILKKLRKSKSEEQIQELLEKFDRVSSQLEMIRPNAAGIDVASDQHWVAIPSWLPDEKPVRKFSAYTCDLHAIRDWLLSHRIATVAMESTGIYWRALCQVLEEAGIEVFLVNARELKSVCGRPKTDKLDCQWIQRLHAYGLLKACFRPAVEIRDIQAAWRIRGALHENMAQAVNRMQKALHEMNVLLPKVVSKITGVTGMKIIRAILTGERDPIKLAAFRDCRIKKSEKEIALALDGTYRDMQVELLRLQVNIYDHLSMQIEKLDKKIEAHCTAWQKVTVLSEDHREQNKKDGIKYRKHIPEAPAFDARTLAHESFGQDVCAIPGIGPGTAVALLFELGPDLSSWPTVERFSSWLRVCPNPRISAGKKLGNGNGKGSCRSAIHFRMAICSLRNSKGFLGAFYRRMKARYDGKYAITATAHKLAVIFYIVVTRQVPYQEMDMEAYDERNKQREIRRILQRAKKYGLNISA